MTIEQTIIVPSNRWVQLPPDVQTGTTAKIAITIPFSAPEYRDSALDAFCLNREVLENPPKGPLPPLLGIAKGSSFTVEQLLKDRRAEES
jgi:hypothetical protein